MHRTIDNDAAHLVGAPPHNNPGNMLYGSGHFDAQCRGMYGVAAWDAACKQAMRIRDEANRLAAGERVSGALREPLVDVNTRVRRVLQHHKLTIHGDAVVEADLIAAVAPDPERFAKICETSPAAELGKRIDAQFAADRAQAAEPTFWEDGLTDAERLAYPSDDAVLHALFRNMEEIARAPKGTPVTKSGVTTWVHDAPDLGRLELRSLVALADAARAQHRLEQTQHFGARFGTTTGRLSSSAGHITEQARSNTPKRNDYTVTRAAWTGTQTITCNGCGDTFRSEHRAAFHECPPRPEAVRQHHPFCPSCGASGFPASVLPGRCEFCDGTEGGNPPEPDSLLGREVLVTVPARRCPWDDFKPGRDVA